MAKKSIRYFYKMLAIILAVSIVPLQIMGFIMFKQYSDDIHKQIYDSLCIFGSSVDNNLSQIKNIAQQMTINGTFDSFSRISESDVINIENSTGPYSSEELLKISKYYDLKAKIYEALDKQAFCQSYIESVYYYDLRKGMIYTNEGTSYTRSEFYDKDVIDLCGKILFSPSMTEPRTISYKPEKNKRVFSYIYGSPLDGDKKIFVININIDKFSQYIFSRQNGNSILILTSKGAVVTQSEDVSSNMCNKFSHNIENVLSSRNEKEIKSDGLHYMKYSKNNAGLQYIYIYNSGWLLGYCSQIMKLMLLLTVVTFVFAMLSSKVIYKPIHSLANMFGEKKSPDIDNYDNDIFKYIANCYNQVENDNNVLKNKLAAIMPYYREKVMLSVLNTFNPGEEWIKQQFQSINVGFNMPGFVVIWFDIKKADIDIINESFIYKEIKIKENIYKFFADEFIECHGIVASNKIGSYIFICNIEQKDYTKTYTFTSNVVENIKKEIGVEVLCGVSSYHSSAAQLSNAWKEAQEAMDFAVFSNSEDIHYYSDTARNDYKQPMEDYSENREKVINCIKLGECEKAEKNFDEFIEAICYENKGAHIGIARIEVAKLLNEMVQTIIETNKNVNDICPDLIEAANTIYYPNSNVSTNNIKEIIQEMCSFTRTENSDRGNKKMKAIINIIETRYGENIGIKGVAEMMGMNPDYMGRTFKEYTGKSYVEYLTGVRIKKSKELLLNTDMKIKDVSEAVGYLNCNYFNKVFKQYTNLTPKEYKQSKSI